MMSELLTAYEVLDLAASHTSAAVDDLNRALALGSAYLICAYKAGKNLSVFQVSIINVLFVAFVSQALLGAMTEYTASTLYYQRVDVDVWTETLADNVANWAVSVFSVACVMAIAACLFFMWSLRHPKPD